MKTAEQIIKETYETNPKFKAQVEAYCITLDEVGVDYLEGEGRFVTCVKEGNVLTLGYSVKYNKVVSCFTNFSSTH